jgi:hypothetical protein
VPKAYSGSGYGTNGFQLKFADNSSNTAATLGKDSAGSNNWTPNNFSVTAGVGNDSLTDTPTSYGTGNSGGDVRGNYATLNPLAITAGGAGTFTNGNLEVTTNLGGGGSCYSSIAFPSSGKWYYEITLSSGSYSLIGLSEYKASTNFNQGGSTNGLFYYSFNGNKIVNGASSAYGASYSTGTVIGVAVDIDSSSVTFYKNNASQGAVSFNAAGMFAAVADEDTGSSSAFVVNFGQRAFAYPLSGFKALVDTNLPAVDPAVAKPNTVFDVKLYTGNGSTQTISGLGFSPDLVWLKSRSLGLYHFLIDTVRGNTKTLSSNTVDGESFATETVINSFDSTGFTLNSDDGAGYYGWNMNGASQVAWAWDAGTSTVTNTAGSITSQVRANASAGFSVVSWTSNGAAGVETMGTGLGVAPNLIIARSRPAANSGNWMVYHSSFSNLASDYLWLNSTNAKATSGATIWSTSSTAFGLRQSSILNNGETAIAYCFAAVSGYSSMSSYVGNGSSDGPFVFTGMRPRWILRKRSDSTSNWGIVDTARLTYNLDDTVLFADLSLAEQTANPNWGIDVLSNGFKVRSSDPATNASGGTYIYFAVAENPFAYARAR